MEIIITIIIAAISSILAGMGVGGGTLFIIFATMFLNMGQKDAQALNLILFIAVATSATISNFKSKKIDKKISIKIIPTLIVGMLIGSFFVQRINEDKLRTYFLLFMLATGLYEIITSLIQIKKAKTNSK